MASRLPFQNTLNLLLSVMVLAPLVTEARTAQPQGVFRSSANNGVVMPQCLYCPQPEYSQKALESKISGTVLLEVTVTLEGQVTKPIVIKGLGAGLDEKALKAVTQWKMKPAAALNGKPVSCRVQIELTFKVPQDTKEK
jgi:TonB family protein